MEIKTIDLITINNMAKAFKQSIFVLYNKRLFNYSNIDVYLTYTSFMDIEFDYQYPLVIDKRQLDGFCKTITMESSFEFTQPSMLMLGISSKAGGGLGFNIDHNIYGIMIERINNGLITDYRQYSTEVTSELSELTSMKKVDGSYKYIHNGNLMTLFPGIMPINKSDKILLYIINESPMTFKSVFTVLKKQNIYITTVIGYFKV